jgi:lipopolysaccharide/colanic/teichoic acid biosynthesis glycosyltransferase
MIRASKGLSNRDCFFKRCFDLTFSLIGLLLFWWLILIGWIMARLSTGDAGFFIQDRVGQHGKIFKVIKLQTMRPSKVVTTTVTSSSDTRITKIGSILRKSKIDELPQLFNVVKGEMSFVGPRPDVPGFADELVDEDRIILTLKPGITGPATIFYKNEEELLEEQEDPELYNAEVVFPTKVKMNIEYIEHYSLLKDMKYILKTILG